MKTTRTKILFASILFSAAMPSMIFSAEAEEISKDKLSQEKIWKCVGFVFNGQLAEAKQWLAENNNIDVNTPDKYQNYLLHYATDKYNVKMTKLLIEHKANVNCRDKENHTALHIFCLYPCGSFKDQEKMVNFLLENNADLQAKDSNDDTPLTLAEKNRAYKLLTLFQSKANDE